MQKTKGIPYIVWIMAIILIVLIGAYMINIGINKVKNVQVDTLKTNLLIIQGKIKLIYDDYQISKNNEVLKGIKMQEKTEDELVKEVLEKKLVDEKEENYEWFYIINSEVMDEIGIKDLIENNDYIIVNYVSKEIILKEPYIDENGQEYYRLTQIKEL